MKILILVIVLSSLSFVSFVAAKSDCSAANSGEDCDGKYGLREDKDSCCEALGTCVSRKGKPDDVSGVPEGQSTHDADVLSGNNQGTN